jgi:hypothetical protein
MSGLTDLLARVNSGTDGFLRERLAGAAAAGEFADDGRFSLGGLVALLSLGARERPREAPEQSDLAGLDVGMLQSVLDRVGSPVRPDQAAEILQLLKSGAVGRDVASALRVTVRFARRLPPELVLDLLELPALPGDVVDAISADLSGTGDRQPTAVLQELSDGQIDRALLPRTLGVLLNRAATRNIAETVRALIGPENRTVRLAILVYARMQGIDLDEKDLDALYRAIDPARPDLTPLLNRGLDRLVSQSSSAAHALIVLRRLRP